MQLESTDVAGRIVEHARMENDAARSTHHEAGCDAQLNNSSQMVSWGFRREQINLAGFHRTLSTL